MSLFSSARRRRRLMWLAIPAGLAAAGALVVWILPSQGGDAPVLAPPTNPLEAPPPANPATERAGRAAAAEVRPLADTFVDDVLHRRDLARAHALLGPALREKYALADWEQGRDLPFSADGPNVVAASSVLSFYGPKTVGFVAAIDEGGAEQRTLVALRFARTNRWSIDYLQRGHSSRFVDQSNYAPHGFLPGSHEETFWTWSILILGFLAVVALVAVIDRRLARGPKDPAFEAP